MLQGKGASYYSPLGGRGDAGGLIGGVLGGAGGGARLCQAVTEWREKHRARATRRRENQGREPQLGITLGQDMYGLLSSYARAATSTEGGGRRSKSTENGAGRPREAWMHRRRQMSRRSAAQRRGAHRQPAGERITGRTPLVAEPRTARRVKKREEASSSRVHTAEMKTGRRWKWFSHPRNGTLFLGRLQGGNLQYGPVRTEDSFSVPGLGRASRGSYPQTGRATESCNWARGGEGRMKATHGRKHRRGIHPHGGWEPAPEPQLTTTKQSRRRRLRWLLRLKLLCRRGQGGILVGWRP